MSFHLENPALVQNSDAIASRREVLWQGSVAQFLLQREYWRTNIDVDLNL